MPSSRYATELGANVLSAILQGEDDAAAGFCSPCKVPSAPR